MTDNQNSNSRNKNSNNKSQIHIRVANDSKQWITEKCGTNTQPPNPPKIPSIGNKIRTERHTMNNKQVEIKEDVSFIINKLKEQLARKTAECEELKSQLKTYSKMIEDPEFKVALTDVKTGEREVWRKLGNKAQRYEQALHTVSEYIEDNCKSCQGIKYGGCQKCELMQIKDIISKAKDGE